MRQCRFCGHINDNALIYCISCDSPLDPTTQSRIPEELRRAIERNKQGLPPEAPSAPGSDISPAATIQDMRASDITLPPIQSSQATGMPGMYNPGQSYEMTSIPVVHQSSTEVVSPYFTPDSAASLDPSVATQIQPPPAQPMEPAPSHPASMPAVPDIPEPAPNPFQPPEPPTNPFQSLPSSPTQAIPPQAPQPASSLPPPNKDFLPVSPTTEYRAPSQETQSPKDWEGLLPDAAKSAPNPLLSQRSGPTPYEDMSVPEMWESQSDISLDSDDIDIYGNKRMSGGLRVLSNFLMIMLMVVSGGFIAVFIYMYWFGQSDNLNNNKEVWRPLERPRLPQPRKLTRKLPPRPRVDPLQSLRRVLSKAQGDINEQEWDDARKKLSFILAAKTGTSLHPQAKALVAKIDREEKADKLLEQARAYAKRRRWRSTMRPLYQIPAQTHAHRKARGLRKLVERKYLRRRMRRIKRNQRRRRYKRVFRGLKSILKVAPNYTPARKRFTKLASYLVRKRSRCLSYCSRRYRRRRRKRGWCRYTCRRRSPKPPKIAGLDVAKRTSNTSNSASSTKSQANTSRRSCKKRCRRWERRQNACFKRYRRRFRYWCRHRCRKRYRGRKRRRCYRRCNRNGYNRAVRRKCRRSRSRYRRCKRRCK